MTDLVTRADFRPNVVIEGGEAWDEFGWVGRRFRIGGVTFRGEDRTTRCAATNVDPATARRDMEIPRDLDRLYGHMDFCIYAVAETGGAIGIGDAVEAPARQLALDGPGAEAAV